MRYPEYRIDFNGKRAILQSRERLVQCIDLTTEDESRFPPSEEKIISCYFMTIEYNELRGRKVSEHISIDSPDVTAEEAELGISQLQRNYHLGPIIFERRKLR